MVDLIGSCSLSFDSRRKGPRIFTSLGDETKIEKGDIQYIHRKKFGYFDGQEIVSFFWNLYPIPIDDHNFYPFSFQSNWEQEFYIKFKFSPEIIERILRNTTLGLFKVESIGFHSSWYSRFRVGKKRYTMISNFERKDYFEKEIKENNFFLPSIFQDKIIPWNLVSYSLVRDSEVIRF